MNLKVVEKHDGFGSFPLFKKDTVVNHLNACDESLHWYACVIDGYETFIPEV